eukprot:Pgem_evm1s16276
MIKKIFSSSLIFHLTEAVFCNCNDFFSVNGLTLTQLAVVNHAVPRETCTTIKCNQYSSFTMIDKDAFVGFNSLTEINIQDSLLSSLNYVV